MIPAERWERVKELFAAALPLEPEGRAALLARECGGDDLLRGEVESLLSAHDGAAGFLDGGTGGGAAVAAAPEAMIGRRLGPYRIVSAIGRGGMGEVYRAVRDDDHFQKVVAVKLVRRGLDDDVVRARFRAERRILARLEHPGIARLLDAGATEEGWPFLVMEHVEGTRIDVYADAQRLDTRARLELFRSVCAAVQYAHQNLVVHRDIKPANILVGADGVPKLLDFGVAKLLDPDVAGPATATGFTPMTPAYASPEQILGQPITTAADVYSLGVVLYELLTGRLPYDLASGQPMELLKAVVEQDPRRASQAGPRPTAPLGSPIDVSVLRRQQLTGDLDDILMMALRKEPQRRYGSVEALSEDVHRCLQGLPVAASRGTFGYRARKFVRRNRAAVAAAVAVAAALVAGTAATAWQARVARAQRARAERRFADVRHLANAMLFDLYDKVRDLPGSTEARKDLVTHALQYLDSLAGEVDGDPGLQRELAAAYRRIGDVQGQSGAANLGDPAAAAANYGKALALYQRLALAAPGDVALQAELVDCQMNVARLQEDAGQLPEAVQSLTAALARAEKAALLAPADVQLQSHLVKGAALLGKIRIYEGDFAAALAVLRRAVGQAESAAAARPDDPVLQGAVINASLNLARALREAAQPEEALTLYAKAGSLYQAQAAREPLSVRPRRGLALVHLESGYVLAAMERWPEALENGQRALAIDSALQKADASNAQPQRALLLDEQLVCRARARTSGRLPGECQAALARAQALAAARAGRAGAQLDVVYAQSNLALALLDAGQPAAALDAFRRQLRLAEAARQVSASDQRPVALAAEAHMGMGKARSARGDWAGALASYRSALALTAPAGAAHPGARATLADLHSSMGDVHASRAAAAAAPERPAAWTEACASYRQALALLQDAPPGMAGPARRRAARGLAQAEQALRDQPLAGLRMR